MDPLPRQYDLYLDVYSHGFRVSRFSDSIRRLLVEFCHRFIKWKTTMVGRSMKREPGWVFAAATQTRDQYFFHRNVLEEFLHFMIERRVPLISMYRTDMPLYVPAKAQMLWHNAEVQSRMHQDEIVEFAMKPEPRTKMITLQAGQGKAVTLTTPIKIPGGWKAMGDIQVDDIVTAKDGSPTRVTGVYPQGMTDIYKVTLWDGRNLECCGEHLWRVFNYNTVPHNRWRVRNTLEMIEQLTCLSSSKRLYIDLPDPEVGEDVPLLMDPYTLGILIGDGSLTGPSIAVSTADQFIVDELTKVPPEELALKQCAKVIDYYISRKDGDSNKGNVYIQKLRVLGLLGKRSYEKTIPEVYMHASSDQRLALLQGLMDADGTAGVTGEMSFSSTSPVLANQVQYLVRSLGGIAKVRARQTYYTHLGERQAGRIAYQVDIRHKSPSTLFRLPRKKGRVSEGNQYSSYLDKIRVRSIEAVGKAETQCISVEHPDRLFVAGGFIVTHNTLSELFYAHEVQSRQVLIMRPMYIKQWVREILKVFSIAKGDMYVVQGVKAMQDLVRLAKEDPDFNPQFVLISNATYRMFLRSFFDHPHEDMGYGCKPWEFFEVMQAEALVIDEVHQDFHLNFLIDCMSNVNKEICMSGTMVADDALMNRLYRIKFPPETYAPRPALKKYIDVYSVYYRFHRPDKLRYLVQSKYHQATYENSILRQPKVADNYTNMIVEMAWHQYYKHHDYRPGSKLAIYCGRHEMCDAVLEKIKAKFPMLDCRRKIDVDPEINLLEADILVTTIPSAGTARDIPDLGVCIATVGLSARQASEQLIHRLREPKVGSCLEGVTPRFIFMSCRDLQKHLGYDEDRRHKLDHVVRNFNTLTSTFII